MPCSAYFKIVLNSSIKWIEISNKLIEVLDYCFKFNAGPVQSNQIQSYPIKSSHIFQHERLKAMQVLLFYTKRIN